MYGVRPSLILTFISYFQDRNIVVKWHGVESEEKIVPDGGPQGAYLDNLTNDSANCVKQDSRFKFVDNLTTLEILNLLLVGMASHYTRQKVSTDVHMSNLVIPPVNLKCQRYLDKIQAWTINKKGP